jgi:gamma-glutamyltranspeptidase
MAIRTLDREHLRCSPFHPRLFGTNGAVTSEHHLAANAGADILKAGGNAVDAVVAAALVEGVVNPHQHTIGGECPMIIQMADEKQPVVVNGNTMAPENATVSNYRARGYSDVPDTGILAAGVPAAVGAYTTALEDSELCRLRTFVLLHLRWRETDSPLIAVSCICLISAFTIFRN